MWPRGTSDGGGALTGEQRSDIRYRLGGPGQGDGSDDVKC